MDTGQSLSRHDVAFNVLCRSVRVLIVAVPVIFVLIFFVDRRVAEAWRGTEESVAYHFLDVADELGRATWYLIPGVGLAVLFYAARSPRWRSPLYVAASVAVSGVLVNLFKILFGRYRPNRFFSDGDYGFSFFAAGYNVSSFPSGHATTVFAAAVALGVLMPRVRVIWWTIAAIAAFGRVATSSHYVSDIVAGAWLGSTTALVLAVYFLGGLGPEPHRARDLQPPTSPTR
jgi:membrane-associated phospholipid phosphatase